MAEQGMAGSETGAGAMFRAGQLQPALEAANAAVRKAPSDLGARILLAEILIFVGNLERADVVLDAAGEADPEAAMVVAEFRQLLRGEMARRQLRRDGRVPEFLGEPTDTQRLQLAALVALRANELAEAARLTAEAEAGRPHVTGFSGDTAFDDFRDADDLCAGSLEVLTTTGKYFWIPVERVMTLEFHPPKRPRDLLWRRASMSVRDGPDGDVYLPAIYGNDDPAQDDSLRMGRATDWVELPGAPVRGVGQRIFLVGEEAVGIMDLTTMEFDVPAAA
jgi:type VI secretion system protein ImpE